MPDPTPPVLDATVGGANANTYALVADADAYNNSRLFASSWLNADTAVKTAALLNACQLLDLSFDWNGAVATATQALLWPRIGMAGRNRLPLAGNIIPPELKMAQAEFARQLIDADRGADNPAVQFGVKQLGVGSGAVNLQFHDTESGDTLDARNANVRRRSKDFDYLSKVVPDAVRNLLVKHWYKESLVSLPLILVAGGGGGRGHRR